MIIIDYPYVSEFLADTLEKEGIRVLKNDAALKLLNGRPLNWVDAHAAAAMLNSRENPLIYTSSENAVGWIAQNLQKTSLPGKVNLFKDKKKFRELLRPVYPDFYFREFPLNALDTIDPDELPQPFVIKPSVGFFSLGVYRVNSPEQWPDVKARILNEVQIVKNTYPEEVLGLDKFIVEEIIEGDEYTIDAYFDEKGHPVILGMMKHIFASDTDTSDRLYITSTAVFRENLGRFRDFLKKLASLVELRNFPVHIEVRVDESGTIRPIEVNPLRFGGWCTSAELTHHAFGINPYMLLMTGSRPDWEKILHDRSDDIFSIIILNNSTGIPAMEIKHFNYEKVLERLEHPLELRKADVVKFHLFGFVYTRTRSDHFEELEQMLHSDLREFVSI